MQSNLAVIADSYSPILVLASLYQLTLRFKMNGSKTAVLDSLAIIFCLIFIYTLMIADNSVHIWHSASLDYSTHSAFAIVWVTYLCMPGGSLVFPAILSLCAYFGLMVYMQYHSIADILTTSLATAPLIFLLMRRMLKKKTIRLFNQSDSAIE